MSAEIDHRRMVEAVLFATEHPLSAAEIADRLPDGADVADHIAELAAFYEKRGINLVEAGGKWMFRTAADLSFLLRTEREDIRKLSRAGVETLAIIAYHQPVTRAEIEEIRGVGISKGTLDILLEAGWVRHMGRRRSPGRPVTYGTSQDFLVHFGLENLDHLPGLEELKAAGLLESVNSALARMDLQPAGGDEGEAELPLEEDDLAKYEKDV